MTGTKTSIEFDSELIKRYDKSGPRYTSYPTAASFHDGVDEATYARHARHSNEDPIPGPISLYVHIPFCDTLCFYCACNKIATKNRSLADTYLTYVEKEADIQSSYYDDDRQVTQLHWGGGTPTFLTEVQSERLMEILSEKFRFADESVRDFSIEVDPRSVTRNGIQHLHDLGFNRFSLGVQDLNEKVQEAVNRIQPVEITLEVIEACRKVGSRSLNIDLIYGLPFQTAESFEKTLDGIIDMSPDRLSVFNYAHMPELFSPQKRIRAEDLPPASEKLVMFQMTIEKLVDAGYVYIGMDHFAKPDDELTLALENGSLQRNFQGYSTHKECDLIAMGTSSISSLDRLFVQNEKTLDTYYERLDKSELPIAKGLELGWDDCIRREVIHQIMCRNELIFDEVDEGFGCECQKYFVNELQQLKPMQEDGLLNMDDHHIQVTPKGRLLIRNIAMVFDAATAKLEEKRTFSKVI
ncbi:MAG: oxygen-independent coproporphyrinogen III oxidase [Gammaproteobacteria bacterium]|nr:MAG: oxygen-independent coproporphyrinogen III oxidase [Gammaproteobacteria bacterium]